MNVPRRILRPLFAVLLLLVGLLRPSLASAQELRELPTTGQRPDAPSLKTPMDVPEVSDDVAMDIPPVPTSYVKIDHGWLKLAYPPAAEERVKPMLAEIEAFKSELSYELGQPVLEHLEIRVVPTVADMARLAPVGVPPPAYASGVAYHRIKLVLVSLMAPRGGDAVDVTETLKHELAHVALEDAVKGHHVPVWFNEGLAIGLSGERYTDRMKVLWSATLSGTLIPFADLDKSFPRDGGEVGIAYAESADFLRFLRSKSDHLRFTSMIERVREGTPFDRALADAYSADLRKLEFQWRGEVERRFSVIPILTGGGLVWVLVIGGLAYAYVRKRRRARAILAKWEKDEAIEDALKARAEALAAAGHGEDVLVRVSVKAPKIEHDGSWHTLH